MKTMRKLLLIAILLPVLLAAFFAQYPHLLLKVPKIGFVLYSLTGAEIPGYFDGKIFAVEDQWKRPGDVFLAVATKCGTTWMMATMHHIRSRGKVAPYRDIYEEVRWAEVVYYPGQSMEERIQVFRKTNEKYPFSIYKTHKQPPVIRVRDDAKYIVGVRSILDAAASLRMFFPNHDVNFAKMWGGFPVDAGIPPGPNSEEKFEHMLMVDIGNGRPMIDVLILDLIRGWLPYRHQKNVMWVHYSNRLKDHVGEIDRMAKFVGYNLTPEELKAVAEQVSFETMKKNGNLYDIQYIFEDYKERGLVSKSIKSVVNELVNVGAKRSGAKELSPKLVQQIKDKLNRDFGPEFAKWLLEGGEFPENATFPASLNA